MRRKQAVEAFGVVSALLLLAWAGPAPAGTLPEVKVSNVRRAFHNGEHNAFTDLVRFRDRFYLTFRSCPDGHMVHPTASIIILASSIVAIGRRGRANAQLLRSKSPYTQWERRELDRYIGGPLLTRWGGRYVVGGRKIVGDKSTTSLCWLVDGQLREFAELPSAGDCSYPGFVELSPTRALVSWYSSHERDAKNQPITAVYLADLEMVE